MFFSPITIQIIGLKKPYETSCGRIIPHYFEEVKAMK